MGKPIKLELPSADSIFSTQEQRDDMNREKVYAIPLTEIDDFPGHPFHVTVDEEMVKMAESVKTSGVHTPAIVRQKEGGRFELVSGHRRKKACEIAGLETMPVIIREMNRDEAIICMVDANLQREKVLPSEKAFSYKMKLEAMKRTAGRPSKGNGLLMVSNSDNGSPLGNDNENIPRTADKLNLTPMVSENVRLRTNEQLGQDVGESREQIRRYIRLTALIPEILTMVDESRIAFRPAVEISYLPETKQRALYGTMQSEACTPSLAQAQKMKRFEESGNLTGEVILSIMGEEKPNQTGQFKMPQERVAKFFPKSYTPKQMEETILQLLETWQKQRDRSAISR